MNLLQGMI